MTKVDVAAALGRAVGSLCVGIVLLGITLGCAALLGAVAGVFVLALRKVGGF